MSCENNDYLKALQVSPSDMSPNLAEVLDVTSDVTDCEAHKTIESLTEKLSAALANIGAKEDLVKQHAKVAEEAVLGWEKAEVEAAVLKQRLDSAALEKSALEDRIDHLDGALKECVRQLRQSREEQERKVQEAIVKKTQDWESEKFELESRFIELQSQLESTKTEATISRDTDLQSKLEAAEKENSLLKVELLALSKDLQLQTLERDLSTRAAETASKQHLESIKKVAKLEVECLKLRFSARRASNDYKLNANLSYVESLTDSLSDSGERHLGVDVEPSCSDSWASALIAELDHFKNDKDIKNLTCSSNEIDLMDDFLEMEQLAASSEANWGSSSLDLQVDSDRAVARDCHSEPELRVLHQKLVELEEKLEKIARENELLEKELSETKTQLNFSCSQMIVAQDRLLELQRHVDVANSSKNVMESEVEALKMKRDDLEFQLKLANLESRNLQEKVALSENNAEDVAALSAVFASKSQDLETAQAERKELESQLILAQEEIQKLQEKVNSYEGVAEMVILSDKLAAKCQDLEEVEAKRKAMESQLELVQLEVKELQQKVVLLEGKLEEERASSVKFAAQTAEEETKRKAAESELNSANIEVVKLQEKVDSLERKVEEEMALAIESAAKCQSLEHELSRKNHETELRQSANSNGEIKLKQEKELAMAAGRLAECQKTIASLSHQLKSLAGIEDMIEDARPDLNGGLLDH